MHPVDGLSLSPVRQNFEPRAKDLGYFFVTVDGALRSSGANEPINFGRRKL
jgi:hypothetical protein